MSEVRTLAGTFYFKMQNQKTVLLGMSGGVDSSVAALLLKKQGYKVVGAFMINFSGTKNPLTNECSYLEDKKDAQKIAAQLKIPLITLNFEKEYQKQVLNEMFKSYAQGITPNPDSLCNKIIKFPMLWQEAKKRKIDLIATGHYIKKLKTKNGYAIKIPKDKGKDQSYFLYDLTQKDLEHTLFPISNLKKEEVRQIAKKHGFPNWNKRGTRGICFIGKQDMKSFLKQKIKPKKGTIIDKEGKVIGTHEGIMFFTIGERIKENQNTTILAEFRNQYGKLYIAEKNRKTNTITAVPENHKLLFKREFQLININWINPVKPRINNAKVRIRHLGQLMPATIIKSINKVLVKLKNPIKAVAEGQSCVIYKDNFILGGGEIRYL